MPVTGSEVMWIAAEDKKGAMSYCPLGFVITGTSVVDKRSNKLVWEAVRMLPEPQVGNPRSREDDYRPEVGRAHMDNDGNQTIGQVDAGAATPTGVVVVGGIIFLALVGYAAYLWVNEEDKPKKEGDSNAE